MAESPPVPPPPSFVLNLGKDSNNLCLHFNPRFNAHGDANTIVCNTKEDGTWGTEHREPAFPFQPGSITEVGGAGQGPGCAGQYGQSQRLTIPCCVITLEWHHSLNIIDLTYTEPVPGALSWSKAQLTALLHPPGVHHL